MANTSNNNNYRSANKVARDYFVNKFNNLWFVRNRDGGKGADILSSHADAIVIGVTAEGLLAKNSLAERVMGLYDRQIGHEYMKAVREGLKPGQVISVNVDLKSGETKIFLLVVIKDSLDDQPDPAAIATGLQRINYAVKKGALSIKSMAIQKLGVGKTQLDWTLVGVLYARELAQFSIQVSVYGIKYAEDIYLLKGKKVVAVTVAECIDLLKKAAMDAPKVHSAILEAPEKKPAKVRAPKKEVSTEAKEEPCGMFRDATPTELNPAIREIPTDDGLALVDTLD